jgi:hypothetical protein
MEWTLNAISKRYWQLKRRQAHGTTGADERRYATDLLCSIPTGLYGSLLPRTQRCYIQFGAPIDLSKYKSKTLCKKRQNEVRNTVAEDIEQMIASLLPT